MAADFAAARAEGRRVHRPVFAYFTAGWCGYCQDMARTTWADPKVAAALEGYVPVKIDVDDHRELANKYQVQGLPSFAILDEDGNPKRFYSGAKSPEQMIGWLNGSEPGLKSEFRIPETRIKFQIRTRNPRRNTKGSTKAHE